MDGASKIVGDRWTDTQRRRVCVQMSTMEVTQLGTWGSRWKERVAFVVVKKNDKKLLSQQRRGGAEGDSIAALMTAGTDGHTNRCHYWAPCRTRQQSELTQAYCAGPDSWGVHTHTNTYSQPQVDSVLPT